jgi:hypothetical protein
MIYPCKLSNVMNTYCIFVDMPRFALGASLGMCSVNLLSTDTEALMTSVY